MIKKFSDKRGDFTLFDANNCDQVNVVTNTKKYTLRGLHYQTDPPQAKTVKVIQGEVLDILFNLETRVVETWILNKHSEPLYVGKKYAHGYLTLEPNTIFTYAVEGEYNPDSEHSLVWSDIPEVNDLILSYIKSKELLTISENDNNGK